MGDEGGPAGAGGGARLRVPAPGRLVGPLWVVTRGSGPPLVLLHGNGEDHHVFDRMVPTLGAGRTLVGVDSRGHGRSPRGDGPLRIATMADDVALVLERLGLVGVDVLGFSDGGNVALELAVRHPAAVGRLVVVGANLDPSGLTAPTSAAVRREHAVVAALARVVPALRVRAERLSLMTRDPCLTRDDVARIAVSSLVVVGERDVVRPEHTRALVDAVPHARLVVVAGAGHMLPRDAPYRLGAVVASFLAAGDAEG
ncbi:alpha/beta hydrolase fold protein [Cellulomonas flavigena DSM 20109]|uniref:Alpha/beta hydrolase fold protein n=1 Tax=Cellulomonas flavigena (strain ATCC 482 / DSM 20109 / BCRC 11376 / JCM 18109 / NBRC 3775 / NCIMB 8073 / NRS 134) TaxID=446466 RepID=D5UBU2_CELFN|nr:alpha/beta hydrolase [Cellulomonas flavigena]ADG74187.1 alpha/beta hydrolase fold protein [Cellulomonas flavigena DSM 20109]